MKIFLSIVGAIYLILVFVGSAYTAYLMYKPLFKDWFKYQSAKRKAKPKQRFITPCPVTGMVSMRTQIK